MKTRQYEIPANLDGERIDLAIVAFDLGLSRRKVRAVIDAGGVYINGKRMRVASRKVRAGDKLRLEYNEDSLRKIRYGQFTLGKAQILFDQAQIVAVNKPPGLPSQATRDQSVQHVEPLLRQALEERDGKRMRPLVLVHRLDKETSGILLLARDAKTATELTDLFRERAIRKEYWALCCGLPKNKAFRVKNYLSPIDKAGKVKAVRSGGKTAETDFLVLAQDAKLGISLIKCLPKTGRSHQIRVHLADLDFPILGDKRYGDRHVSLPPELISLSNEHHFLHARALTFAINSVHQAANTPASITLQADLPDNFGKAMAWLGAKSAHFDKAIEALGVAHEKAAEP